MNIEKSKNISDAMSKISFSNVLLDAALLEISEFLAQALDGKRPEVGLPDEEQNRVGAAHAMGFAAALLNLQETEDLEAFMLSLEFLDEDDVYELKIVKGVMLDCLLVVKIDEVAPDSNFATYLRQLRRGTAEILHSHGYGGAYFPLRSVS